MIVDRGLFLVINQTGCQVNTLVFRNARHARFDLPTAPRYFTRKFSFAPFWFPGKQNAIPFGMQCVSLDVVRLYESISQQPNASTTFTYKLQVGSLRRCIH